jgi:hypothetical protein
VLSVHVNTFQLADLPSKVPYGRPTIQIYLYYDGHVALNMNTISVEGSGFRVVRVT